MNIVTDIEIQSGNPRRQTPPLGGVAPVSRRVMNLAHFLTQAARRTPDAPALVHGAQRLSWHELDQRVSALALALHEHGVRQGDRILVHSRNNFAMVETQYAAFRLGAVWVPTNFRLAPDEAAWLAENAGASVFFVQSGFDEHIKAVENVMPAPRLIIGLDDTTAPPNIDALIAPYLGQTFRNADVQYDDPCWFFFTSGTTGRPKAAVLTHGQMGFVITNHLCDLMPGTDQETDASLVVAPLSHGAGIHLLTQVARGVVSVLSSPQRLDPHEIWSLIETYRITNLFTVPTIVNRLIEDPAVDRFNHGSLRYLIYAGAPMYRADQQRALQKLGAVLVQYFGLGEVTGNITVLPPAQHSLSEHSHAGSCGYERTAIQISIQDEQGEECLAGQTGEICVCGPAVFAGYYNNDEANAKAFRNGWFRTGDLGYMDPQGYLTITGRASDMYISGGSNIYPREIEEKILMHPAIAQAAILGVPDPRWGEAGLLVCVCQRDQTISANALLDWLKPQLARYKLPRDVVFWDELPRSGYGKVTKKLIRERLVELGLIATPESL